jgi:hypothetical protein
MTAGAPTDYRVAGIVAVRVFGASTAERHALERQLGGCVQPCDGTPDITVRFVDRLPVAGLRYVEVDRSGFAGDAFLIRSNGRRAAWARVPFAEIGGPCEFVCERGVARVPLLKQVLRLTALAKGYLPFHGSAFEWRETGVLVAGWSHGGKKSALLAFAAHGARYVADDLVLLARDGGVMRGLASPIALSEWHLGQLPHARRAVGLRRLLLSDAVQWIERARRRAVRGDARNTPTTRLLRAAARLGQQGARTVLPLDVVFPGGCSPSATPRKLFFMLSNAAGDLSVQPAHASSIAERMSHSLRFENVALLSQYLAYRFALSAPPNEFLELAHERERALLRSALAGLDSYVVSHPYPAPFRELYDGMRPFCEERQPNTPALQAMVLA